MFPRMEGTSTKVLVIDDNEEIRKIVRAGLERHGCTVTEAENGRDGFKQLSSALPDLLITDLVMPEQEGLETIQKVRKTFPNLKIIAMSGGGPMDTDDLLHVANKLGANATLAKPFSLDTLWNEVQNVLKNRC